MMLINEKLQTAATNNKWFPKEGHTIASYVKTLVFKQNH